ncbi:hypothetical protein [Streptomyces sp. SID10815]|uniref:hypothetical protein n=1 Tax=Streptomyces sp. SID10815 TaxID=2706027 RepID=UPI0013C9451B|nr:hypothetical protein [Streptomyces sp. SID10815]NEA46684.1 hypothetical protein [Streptomyces sp. SID10815]
MHDLQAGHRRLHVVAAHVADRELQQDGHRHVLLPHAQFGLVHQLQVAEHGQADVALAGLLLTTPAQQTGAGPVHLPDRAQLAHHRLDPLLLLGRPARIGRAGERLERLLDSLLRASAPSPVPSSGSSSAAFLSAAPAASSSYSDMLSPSLSDAQHPPRVPVGAISRRPARPGPHRYAARPPAGG